MEWSKETIENSILHGKSFTFTTIQYNYKLQKVFLSYSDCGRGFKNSFFDKLDEQDRDYDRNLSNNIQKKILKLRKEVDGIFLGIYYRYGSSFGLYSVIMQVLTKGGIIRIHSNDTQVVLSPSNLNELSFCNNETEFFEQMLRKNNSIRNELKYPGTHIEIEIPVKKKDLKNEKL